MSSEEYDIGSDIERAIRLTASRANAIYSKDSRSREARAIVAARIKQQVKKSFQTEAMRNGVILEPIALDETQIKLGIFIDTTKFKPHKKIPMFGATPDGQVQGTNDLVEVKCMQDDGHLKFAETGKIPLQYQRQMLAQCSVYGSRKVHFVAFNPAYEGDLRLVTKLFEPSEENVKNFEEDVILFLEEVDKLEIKLRSKIDGK